MRKGYLKYIYIMVGREGVFLIEFLVGFEKSEYNVTNKQGMNEILS